MEECCNITKANHSDDLKKKLKNRLNRIEGQVRGVNRMIEEDVYCDNVLTQISSIKSALNSTAKLLLEAHMKSCVIEKIEKGEEKVIDELLITIKKMMK